jgi:hypothetical protein
MINETGQSCHNFLAAEKYFPMVASLNNLDLYNYKRSFVTAGEHQTESL